MGAWGEGHFENDSALDFVGTVVNQETLTPVVAALDALLAQDDYIDAYYAEEALAAAEVVALLKGHPNPATPDELTRWQQTHALTASPELVAKSIKAVERASADPEASELYELWEESEEVDAWLAHVNDLLARLRG